MNYPTIMPALTLDFANSRQLDPRVTFSRSSSATYLNPDTGLIALANDHEARIEKDGLLIEESRTNFIKNSTAIQLVQSNCSVALSVGPDGTNTATTATSSADGTFSVNANPNRGTVWTSPASTTWSCYLKSSQISSYRIDLVSGGGQGGITVSNITTDPVFSSIASRITNYGVQEIPGGWYRFWAVYDSTLDNATGMAMRVAAYDGVAGNSFQIGGEQCEIGSFPTSLIPTAGSTATRAGEVATISSTNLSSWYNPNSSTIVSSQIDIGVGESSFGVVWGFGTGGANRIELRQGGGNLRRAFYINRDSSSSGVAPLVYTKTSNSERYTIGVAINAEGADYAAEGVGVTGDTFADATMPIINTVYIAYGSAPDIASKTIARLSYYNERLTDAELQTITS